jgi:Na+/proline symporter
LFPSRSIGAQRTLAALASLAVTLLGTLWVFVVPFPSDTILYALASSLAPLAALVMLGLTSRRATPAVALATLVVGVAAGVVISLGLNADPRARIHPLWAVTVSFAGTFLLGQLLALVFGESRRRGQMQGLVLGPVPIGALHHEEASVDLAIDLPESSEPTQRWKT